MLAHVLISLGAVDENKVLEDLKDMTEVKNAHVSVRRIGPDYQGGD